MNDPDGVALGGRRRRDDARSVDVGARAARARSIPRFTWRRGDVPAASHPTIAAALARVAGVRDDDVVWDPFVGSGAELVERALLGPVRALLGSDIDPRALAVARENLAAAGVDARLEQPDALDPAPAGRDAHRHQPADGPARRRAPPGSTSGSTASSPTPRRSSRPRGRLVVDGALAEARASGRRAARASTLDWARAVDMGGFDAEIQRWVEVAPQRCEARSLGWRAPRASGRDFARKSMRSIFVTMPDDLVALLDDGDLRVGEHALEQLDLRVRRHRRVVVLDDLGDGRVERLAAGDERAQQVDLGDDAAQLAPLDDRAAG